MTLLAGLLVSLAMHAGGRGEYAGDRLGVRLQLTGKGCSEIRGSNNQNTGAGGDYH